MQEEKKKKKTNDTSTFQKRICEQPTIRQQAKSGFVEGEASPQLQSLFGIDSGAWGTGILRTPGSHWVGPSGRARLCRGSCSAYVTGRQGRGPSVLGVRREGGKRSGSRVLPPVVSSRICPLSWGAGMELLKPLEFPEWWWCLCYANEVTREGPPEGFRMGAVTRRTNCLMTWLGCGARRTWDGGGGGGGV